VRIESFQDNDLVGLDPGGFVHGPRVETFEPEVAFGSDDIESRGLMNGIEAIEVQIPTVDDIEGSGFEDQLIEDFDVVDLAMGDNNEAGDTSPEIQESMQFHGAFVSSELGPREKRETEIDRGGVQCISGLIQFDAKGIVGIKTSSTGNKNLGKVYIDPPIPYLVGMSQGIA